MALVNLEEWSVPQSIDEFFSRYNDERVINPFTKKEEVVTLVDCIKSMREVGIITMNYDVDKCRWRNVPKKKIIHLSFLVYLDSQEEWRRLSH